MSLDLDIQALARAPMLREIGRDALRLLAFSAEPHNLRAGDVLFERGDPAEGGFVIVVGKVLLIPEEGQPERVLGPGALLGEVALLTETVRPVRAVAQTPAKLLGVPRTLFRRMLEEYPDIAGMLRRLFADRLAADAAELEAIRSNLVSLDRPSA